MHNLFFVVAQLNRRENQPDRMTMIAIADGNQVHNFLTSFILTKQILGFIFVQLLTLTISLYHHIKNMD